MEGKRIINDREGRKKQEGEKKVGKKEAEMRMEERKEGRTDGRIEIGKAVRN